MGNGRARMRKTPTNDEIHKMVILFVFMAEYMILAEAEKVSLQIYQLPCAEENVKKGRPL